MKRCVLKRLQILVVPTLIVSFLMSQMAYGQGPLVSQDELKQAMVHAASVRQENLKQVRGFFSTNEARRILKSAHIDAGRVDKAVSGLDAEELAKLAAETRQVQTGIAAGSLTNQQITYILIALATAVIILVLKH